MIKETREIFTDYEQYLARYVTRLNMLTGFADVPPESTFTSRLVMRRLRRVADAL